jgi:hypothetical protein
MGFRNVLPQCASAGCFRSVVCRHPPRSKTPHYVGNLRICRDRQLHFYKKKLHYYYRLSDRPIDRHGVLPKRVRILWDWEDLKDGDSGWPAAQPIRQNPGSEGLIRFRHRIDQAIPITACKG